jgi:5'(3')-deoxyribonucleotidase
MSPQGLDPHFGIFQRGYALNGDDVVMRIPRRNRQRLDNAQADTNPTPFVFGVDLDGVCADFYGHMREIVAEWKGVDLEDLSPSDFEYGLAAWGVADSQEYERIHRFAVTQRDLFKSMPPVPGAAQSIRRLSAEGVEIRIITHRLFIDHFHQTAVAQTVSWLDAHGIPYRDLCFMKDKVLVDADVYIEDTEKNIRSLEECNETVIAFTNPTNVNMNPPPTLRADSWQEAEQIVRAEYYSKLEAQGRPLPQQPGLTPGQLLRR